MKKIICFIAILVVITNCCNVFASNGEIDFLKNMEILSGYANGDLKLENDVTRAEFAKMAILASKYKIFVADEVYESPFKDVKFKHWAAPYVLVALKNGIMQGYPDATFRPEENILYEEAITVAIQLLGYSEKDYGTSWPYGQINLAKSIGLTNNIDHIAGQNMQRKDIIMLISNMFTAKNQDGKFYAESLGYTIKEKTNLISVSDHLIYTNDGYYESYNNISVSYAGTSGTLILDQENIVMGYITNEELSVNSTTVGYVIEVGAKTFNENGKNIKEYFAKIISPTGNPIEYKTKIPYKNYLNQVVEVSFEDGYTKFKNITDKYNISGKFNWENKTIGKYDISPELEIIDVYSTSYDNFSLYKNIHPQRIDGVYLEKSNVAYYQLNAKNELCTLILKNVTGDMLKYGIVTKAENTDEEYYMSGEYEYDVAGTIYTLTTNNKLFTGVSRGTPAKFVIKDEEVKSMQSLTALKGKISELTNTYLKSGAMSYPISDEVVVYLRNYYGTYLILDLDELIAEHELYNIYAYYDKAPKTGGRIRVIIAAKK